MRKRAGPGARRQPSRCAAEEWPVDKTTFPITRAAGSRGATRGTTERCVRSGRRSRGGGRKLSSSKYSTNASKSISEFHKSNFLRSLLELTTAQLAARTHASLHCCLDPHPSSLLSTHHTARPRPLCILEVCRNAVDSSHRQSSAEIEGQLVRAKTGRAESNSMFTLDAVTLLSAISWPEAFSTHRHSRR